MRISATSKLFWLLRGLRDRGAVALVSGSRAQPSNVGGSGARPFFLGRPGWVPAERLAATSRRPKTPRHLVACSQLLDQVGH
jgi:hypothetical protein